ncbi:unnamed protein product [Adineta steineri]|uniref:Tyrosine-protein kinase ephrin type A/B receptor-like domain-containing protein n=1 Tax=Adineta steineri TaxID=433720 RepID=A0A813PF37_9BILA|nr:unnamed protein product [Adineta steineri]CAF3488098.1 unnamed protein product [Adineta steineri]
MILIHDRYLFIFILLHIHHLNGLFVPDTTDYDAYGSKITMNDQLLVLAQNNYEPPSFFIQFSPYNQSLTTSSQCVINYPNTTNTFMYSVSIGKKQNQSQMYFFFIGEHTNDQSGIFIGMTTYNNINQTSNLTLSLCDTSFSYSFHYINNYDHQEYFILGVHPLGLLAYGFSNEFIVMFDVQNSSNPLNIWNGNLIWSDNSFIPHAIDISDNFAVVAGFIKNDSNSTVQYNPIIYLLNFNSTDNHRPYIVNVYQPTATPGTWQDLLTNSDAGTYSAKYDMSVSINEQGNVLVGMQFINRVFYFSVNITNPIILNNISRFTNGRSIGNGKSITWLSNGVAAIMINTYTLDYIWSSSQIYFFDIYQDGYNSNSTPLSVFPNSHQLVPSSFNSVFLNIISSVSSSSLALLDNKGSILIFSPTQAQFYPFIQDTGSSPFITTPKACMPGTYKNKSGIHDCLLCPTGTKNPGNASDQCISCLNGSFCPLGSVADISQSALNSIFQVVPYPQSPESTIFDEILIHSMFTIGPGRCVLISPLFWALIVAGVVIIIIIIMEILKLCTKDARSKKLRHIVKCTFRHTDLIGEGEFWIGGLVSFSILVLVCFAYAFSSGYLKQYPIETSTDSDFTCDKTMRNAKFDTNIQSLSIPRINDEQEMFDLLNNQAFILNIGFINTLINCDAISIQAQFGTTWSTIRWLDCNNVNSILTLSIPLPYQHISVQVFLADTKTIGALRMGLSGVGHESERYTLRELEFYQTFSIDGQILSQTLPVALVMTKIINETKPMVGEESNYGGIFIPTFTVDMNSLFVTNNQYVLSSSTLTTLTIAISETPYYVKNVQQPITRKSEVIFRCVLFTVVCIEIFGLVFLSYKLVFKPLYHAIMRKHRPKEEKELSYKTQTDQDSRSSNSSRIRDINTDYISSSL